MSAPKSYKIIRVILDKKTEHPFLCPGQGVATSGIIDEL